MCGVFGIRSEERDVSRLAYFGLFALQHRGQESAGIAVSDGGRLTVVREMGLVAHVFDEQQLQALPWWMCGCAFDHLFAPVVE